MCKWNEHLNDEVNSDELPEVFGNPFDEAEVAPIEEVQPPVAPVDEFQALAAIDPARMSAVMMATVVEFQLLFAVGAELAHSIAGLAGSLHLQLLQRADEVQSDPQALLTELTIGSLVPPQAEPISDDVLAELDLSLVPDSDHGEANDEFADDFYAGDYDEEFSGDDAALVAAGVDEEYPQYEGEGGW